MLMQSNINDKKKGISPEAVTLLALIAWAYRYSES